MTDAQWSLVQGDLVVMVIIAALCFVVGELTGNVSQVDKLWSILPVLYSWIVTVRSDFDGRMVLMSLLATVWGARLTYNFSRQGGYSWRFWSGAEDYRWAYVRRYPVLNTRIGWLLFDLVFICAVQNFLLLWIASPIVDARGAPHGLGAWDAVLAVAFLALVALETYADQAQWTFQNEKHRRRTAGEPLDGRYSSGFIRDGIWSRTRHPNYLAEQGIWIVYFLFAVVATHHVDWTIGGCLLLVALFQGSSRTSENIQLAKYPDYPAYQRRVPRFLPWPKARLLRSAQR
jgi:steroid 5-alpha reductase family enzyme